MEGSPRLLCSGWQLKLGSQGRNKLSKRGWAARQEQRNRNSLPGEAELCVTYASKVCSQYSFKCCQQNHHLKDCSVSLSVNLKLRGKNPNAYIGSSRYKRSNNIQPQVSFKI